MKNKKKLKKYVLSLFSILFAFTFVFLSGKVTVNAYDPWQTPGQQFKTKSFYIYGVGDTYKINIWAICDVLINGQVKQEPGWHSEGRSDYRYNRPGTVTWQEVGRDANGYRTIYVSINGADITNWTPFLEITTDHHGFLPVDWEHTKDIGGTGNSNENGNPEAAIPSAWSKGTCMIDIGMAFRNNSITCLWDYPYTVRYDGNGATGGSMPSDQVQRNAWYGLRDNAFKRQYTVSYNAAGGQCPTASNVATAQFNGWSDPNPIGAMQYESGYGSSLFTESVFNGPYYANKNIIVNDSSQERPIENFDTHPRFLQKSASKTR